MNEKNLYDIYLLAKNDHFSKIFKDKGFNCIDWNLNKDSINLFTELKSLIYLVKVISSLKPDYVFTFTPKANIYAAMASRILKFNFFPNITGMGSYYIKNGVIKILIEFSYKVLLKKAKYIFVQNNSDKKLFIEKYNINESKLLLLPGSGINITKYKPKYLFNTNCKKFLIASRLVKEKGIREFYHAAKMLIKNFPNIQFHLFGEYEHKNKNSISVELFNKIKELKNIKYFKFQNNLKDLMHNYDCLILPSYREGMSRFLLEGIAMGKPLLVSNAPGCKELCNGSNGFIFKVKSSNSLYKSIIKMTKLKREDLIKMGKESRLLAEKEYSIKIVQNKYFDVLNSF